MILLGLGSIVGGCGISWLIIPDLYFFDIGIIEKLIVLLVIFIGGLIGFLLGYIKKREQTIIFSFFFWKYMIYALIIWSILFK